MRSLRNRVPLAPPPPPPPKNRNKRHFKLKPMGKKIDEMRKKIDDYKKRAELVDDDDDEDDDEMKRENEEDEMADFIDDDDASNDTESVNTDDIDMQSDTDENDDNQEEEEEENEEAESPPKNEVKVNKKIHDAEAASPSKKKTVKRYAEPDQLISKVDMINLPLSKEKEFFSVANGRDIVKPVPTVNIEYSRWQEQHGDREAYFFADDGVSE